MTVSFDAQPLVVQLPVEETASILNRRASLTGLKVLVAFGKKRAGVGSTGFENTILERWNAATDGWARVTLSPDSSGIMRGSFSAALPAGASSLRLRIAIGQGFVPQQDGNEAPLSVSLTRNSTVVAQQQLTLPVQAPTVALDSQPTTMKRGGQAEFQFTIKNSTSATYPAFGEDLNLVCQTATIICNAASGDMLAGFSIDVFDGSAWKPLAVGHAASGATFVDSGVLAAGASKVIRLRLTLGPDLDVRATSFSLMMFIGPPEVMSHSLAWARADTVTISA